MIANPLHVGSLPGQTLAVLPWERALSIIASIGASSKLPFDALDAAARSIEQTRNKRGRKRSGRIPSPYEYLIQTLGSKPKESQRTYKKNLGTNKGFATYLFLIV